MPGMPHAYEPNPQHPSGKSNEEIYRLTQRQRRLERAIRASKREVAAAERAYEADPTLKNQTTANQLREQLRKRQDALAKLVDENRDVLARDLRREYAGDMPRVKVPTGSARSVSEYLMQPSVAERIEADGVSLTKAKQAIAQEMRARELKPSEFPRLTQQQQGDIGDAALSGAIRGDDKRMDEHAVRYYEAVRKMHRPTVVAAIERESGITKEEAERAFSHLFIEEHDLGENGVRRFYEDYEISQSMQRILQGRGICQHDRLLFQHELVESIYMARGIPQGQAHDQANLLYNYQEALFEWLKRGARPGD